MSSWLSYENFLYSRTASWCRWALTLIGVGGVCGDYYLTHNYHAFDPAQGTQYVVDVSSIGRTRCQMLLIPNSYYTNYSPWTPKNGDVVIARELAEHPNFLQLLNGRFVERQTCGVPLLRPLEEVEQERAELAAAEERLLAFVNDSRDGAAPASKNVLSRLAS